MHQKYVIIGYSLNVFVKCRILSIFSSKNNWICHFTWNREEGKLFHLLNELESNGLFGKTINYGTMRNKVKYFPNNGNTAYISGFLKALAHCTLQACASVSVSTFTSHLWSLFKINYFSLLSLNT